MKHKKTAEYFVRNIRRAMRVASHKEVEFPINMTHKELTKQAEISRSTLANIFNLDDQCKKSPNPTLETICTLAEVLNVPPAFLLMRNEDWTRLAQAINFYVTLHESKKGFQLFSEIEKHNIADPTTRASLALKIAKTLEIDGHPTQHFLDSLSDSEKQEILTLAKSRRLSIYATSSLPPIDNMKSQEKIASFFVSTIFGAHYKSDK